MITSGSSFLRAIQSTLSGGGAKSNIAIALTNTAPAAPAALPLPEVEELVVVVDFAAVAVLPDEVGAVANLLADLPI